MEIGWTAVALAVTFPRRHTPRFKETPQRGGGGGTTRRSEFEFSEATRIRLPSPRRAVWGFRLGSTISKTHRVSSFLLPESDFCLPGWPCWRRALTQHGQVCFFWGGAKAKSVRSAAFRPSFSARLRLNRSLPGFAMAHVRLKFPHSSAYFSLSLSPSPFSC